MELFEHNGRMHGVEFNGAALAAIKASLENLGVAPGSFPWPPRGKPSAEPYPGLSALGEDDAGIFFGRDADIMNGLAELRLVRRRGSPRLFVIQAASGAGKSSFSARRAVAAPTAGPRFRPARHPAPGAGHSDRTGRARLPAGALVRPQRPDQNARRIHAALTPARQPDDMSAVKAADAAAVAALGALMAEATALATDARRATVPEARPPAPLLAIDQGEELFAAEDALENGRFLQLLAAP